MRMRKILFKRLRHIPAQPPPQLAVSETCSSHNPKSAEASNQFRQAFSDHLTFTSAHLYLKIECEDGFSEEDERLGVEMSKT